VGGGELGWLRQGDLPQELEEQLMTLDEGQVSGVVRGPGGFHVFLLHEREQSEGDVPPYEEVREYIFRQMLDVAMARQEELFLTELRRGAMIERRI
jgi:parvulin-like peptidyl-prolyl isomerase